MAQSVGRKTTRKALYKIVEDALREDIRIGVYPEDSQLPSEHALMEKYGVSRVTIRSALQGLASKGIISTSQGRGSFVKPGKRYISMRLDEFTSFYSLISRNGLQPDVSVVGWEETPFSSDVCAKLGIEPSSRGFVFYRVFTGDGKPAVLAEEYMPFSSMRSEFISSETSELIGKLPNSILDFADIVCTNRISSSFIELSAQTGFSPQAEKYFSSDGSTAMLCLDETLLSASGSPILFSRAFVNTDMIHFQFMRERPIG